MTRRCMANPVPQSEADRLSHYLGLIVRSSGVTDWERKFCATAIAQARRSGIWRPSPKQVAIATRLVDRFLADQLTGDIIEDHRS